MNAFDQLVAALPNARVVGKGRARAPCPVCSESRSSTTLSITDRDGTVLLHCFRSQCGAADILHAVGLSLADLYDRPLSHHQPPHRPKRPRIDYRAALELVRHELLIVALAAGDLARGGKLSEVDLAAVRRALANIEAIAQGQEVQNEAA